MVCYAILCYVMVWKFWYAMKFHCYAMVYVVKDKHMSKHVVNYPYFFRIKINVRVTFDRNMATKVTVSLTE